MPQERSHRGPVSRVGTTYVRTRTTSACQVSDAHGKGPILQALFLIAYRYAEPGERSVTMKSRAPTAGESEQRARPNLRQPRQALIRQAWQFWPS